MKLNSIVMIGGRIASGKSFVANLIGNKFDMPIASFGAYLKYYCEQNRLPIDRKNLQDIGDAFVKKDLMKFSKDVISHFIGTSDKIIIEGVRHRALLAELIQQNKNHVAIYVFADFKTRYNRYVTRHTDMDGRGLLSQFIEFDNHPVEQEIESLRPLCDLEIDTTQDYSSKLFEEVNKLFPSK
jgi:cytidylate kinase